MALGGKADGAARRGDLDGIVYDVLHDLMHKIRVGIDRQRVAAQPLYVDFAVLNACLLYTSLYRGVAVKASPSGEAVREAD